MTPTTMDPITTIRLVVACGNLSDLEAWPMLGPRIEAARGAMLGVGGVTAEEVATLEGYARRWTLLREDLRAFYRALAPTDETASVALWKILHGGAALEDWQEGKLRRLYEEAVGHAPAIEICPRRRREW
jgi:hypothetical protein